MADTVPSDPNPKPPTLTERMAEVEGYVADVDTVASGAISRIVRLEQLVDKLQDAQFGDGVRPFGTAQTDETDG